MIKLNFKLYPIYKDSGISWIGDIPEFWEVEKIKNISQVKPSNVDKKTKDNQPSVLLCNYTDVYNNEFITMKLDFMKATASYDQIKKLSLNVGDIIITKDSESADDIAVPSIVTEELENVVCGYHLAIIRPIQNIIDPKFLFRCFESDRINKQFEHGANGVTRFGLGIYPINNAYVCLPPLKEQKQMANFLDKKIAKIEETITKNQQLIQLLEEKRIALINLVVTKGLNPDVPLKDSGVEWIGEIPEHWDFIPVDKFSSFITDYVANGSFASLRENVEYLDEEDYAILVRLIDNSNNFNGPFVYINEDSYNFLSKTKLKEGDIVLANIGATLGTIFKVPNLSKPMSLGPNVLLIRFKNNINGDYFLNLIDSKIGKCFIDSITTQTTQPKFNKTELRKLRILHPPLNEQKQINNEINKINHTIKTTINKIKEQILLLKEYKTSLINNVVTGKVDVRGEEI